MLFKMFSLAKLYFNYLNNILFNYENIKTFTIPHFPIGFIHDFL